MAGIYSQGGSAGHRYAGWLSKVEAKNFHFGGKVFNGSPSAIYVGSNLVWFNGGLTTATMQAIMDAFGADGPAVIAATNEYLNGIAAQDQAGRDKATALAGFINEDPMMVCSLGLEPQGVTMPDRTINGDGYAYIDTGYKATINTSMDIQFLWPGSINTRYASLIECDGGGFEYGINHWNSFYWNYGGYMSFSGIAADTKFYIETRKNVLTLYRNGSVVTTATRGTSTSTSTTNGNLPLFAWRRRGSVMTDYITNAHIWFLRIYDGETKVRDFIPCKHNGENGMLDMVNMTWHGNVRGQGSFTIPDISYTPTP